MRDIEVMEGDVTLLKCEIMGNPTPTINWYREGKFTILGTLL